nr:MULTISPECIES: hypothetical protein [Xanthomonas]
MSERIKQKLDPDGSVLIPKGQFAFLITDEKIRVPTNAIAFISIKAGIKFRGLVNVSGFHVDPGYDGRLVFSVFNAGASDVKLHRDERAFLIWFASLDEESTRPKKKEGFKSIPSTLLHGLSEESLSLSVLNARLTEAESKIHRVIWASGVLLTALTLSLGLWKILHEPGGASSASENNIPQAQHQPLPPVMLDYVWKLEGQSGSASKADESDAK